MSPHCKGQQVSERTCALTPSLPLYPKVQPRHRSTASVGLKEGLIYNQNPPRSTFLKEPWMSRGFCRDALVFSWGFGAILGSPGRV